MRFSWDQAVAVLCLVVGLGISWTAYDALQRSEAVSEIVIPDLTLGEHYYSLMHQGVCFGHAEATVTYDSSLALSFIGEIGILSGQTRQPIRIVGALITNALDQLTQATFSASSVHGKIQLELNNINPVRITLKTEPSLPMGIIRGEVEGPVTVTHKLGNELHISMLTLHARSSLALQGTLTDVSMRLRRRFSVEKTPQKSANRDCTTASLDLEQLGAEMLPLLPALQQQLGGGSL